MKNKTKRKVFVALRLDIMPGRQELIGIFQTVKRMSLYWDIELKTPQELTVELLSGPDAPDGLISSELELSEGVTEFLSKSSMPVVLVDAPKSSIMSRENNIVQIHTDNREIGKLAAKHLLEKGRFASYGFVPMDGAPSWSVERQESFIECIGAVGSAVKVLPETMSMAEWLKSLHKPAAVFVACDRKAVKVVEATHETEIAVPKDLAILSVDNDEMYCNFYSPTISSIEPCFEREGCNAVEEMQRMLRTATPLPAKIVVTSVKDIVERESTAEIPPAEALVRRAIDFIAQNATKRINVRDVVREVGVSRRLLDLRFSECRNESVHDVIIKRKLMKVKHLLRTTNLSSKKIAAAAGFRDGKYLMATFQRECGMTMSDYRRVVSR